ncbi:MAG: HIT family protein [Acidiferrobacterales bacterium]
MAKIHPQLLLDCVLLGRFELNHLLLMQDANYPWFILVPDRDGISEIYQLSEIDQQLLTRESALLSSVLSQQLGADKLNIAALGNIVPQLHIHHVVRYQHDAAWPAPVWGKVPARPYEDHHLQAMVEKIKPLLEGNVEFFD